MRVRENAPRPDRPAPETILTLQTRFPSSDDPDSLNSEGEQRTFRDPEHTVDAGNFPQRPAKSRNSASVPARFPHLFNFCILALFTVVLLWPLCIGRSLYWGDVALYFEPVLRFAQSSLRHGEAPLWNRFMNCGQPYVGNPQSAVFYPTTILLLFMPAWLFISVNTILHLFLCGAFAYRFLCRWTLHRGAALSGALVYMGSACLVSRLQFPTMVQTAAYFPLLLAGVDAAIDRPGLRATACVAVTIGLTVLAGHPQVAYLSFLCTALYSLSRLWSTWQQESRPVSGDEASPIGILALPATRRLFVAAGLGLLLAAVQILPSLQLLRFSPRDQMSLGQANRFYLNAPQLLSLVLPRFFGHPAAGDYWGTGNAWEPSLFVGWLPLVFIAYSVVRCGRESLVRFWAVAGLIGIWLATGNDGRLYQLAFFVVPGLSSFHDPARFLLITTFAFAVLTAVGYDAWCVRKAWFRRRARQAALFAVALPLLWFGQAWNPTLSHSIWRYRPAVASALKDAVGDGRLYSLTHEIYWRRFVTEGYEDYGPNSMGYLRTLRNAFMANTPMRYGIEEVFAYEPVAVEGTADIDGMARYAMRRAEPNTTRLMALMGARTFLLADGQTVRYPRLNPLRLPGADKGEDPGVHAWVNADGLPGAWLVRKARRIEGSVRVLASLAAPDFNPAETAVVTGGQVNSIALPGEWGAAGVSEPVAPVAQGEQDATSRRFTADCGKSPAYLVWSATAYPGWKAVVDGKARPLFRTDGAFLGLPLGPGRHHVRFLYRPQVYAVGLYLTLVCAGILAACFTTAAARGIMLNQQDHNPRVTNREEH